jgi:multiple sugar transport system ATP-binding protein
MNLVKAVVRDGGAALETPKYRLPVPASRRVLTSGMEGKSVVCGIRPENLTEGKAPRGESAKLTGEVEIAEPLGHEVIVHCRVGDDLLVAKVEHRIPKMGERIELTVELDSMHLFDAETEKRIAETQI